MMESILTALIAALETARRYVHRPRHRAVDPADDEWGDYLRGMAYRRSLSPLQH